MKRNPILIFISELIDFENIKSHSTTYFQILRSPVRKIIEYYQKNTIQQNIAFLVFGLTLYSITILLVYSTKQISFFSEILFNFHYFLSVISSIILLYFLTKISSRQEYTFAQFFSISALIHGFVFPISGILQFLLYKYYNSFIITILTWAFIVFMYRIYIKVYKFITGISTFKIIGFTALSVLIPSTLGFLLLVYTHEKLNMELELFNMPLSVTQLFVTDEEKNELLKSEWTTYYLGFTDYPELKFEAPCDSIPTEINKGDLSSMVDIEQTGSCHQKELGLGIRVTHARFYIVPDMQAGIDNYFNGLKQNSGITDLFYDKEYISIKNGNGMIATGSYNLYGVNRFKFNTYFIQKENKLWILFYECNQEDITEVLFNKIALSIESSF